ncbi:hypothetical protein DFJ74DRAFT_655908 [Hyaloraphidium curvatum]|nr:hypothetical protein DFJ74DRAFT_655908 [Hyaloraphidium curvatum]
MEDLLARVIVAGNSPDGSGAPTVAERLFRVPRAAAAAAHEAGSTGKGRLFDYLPEVEAWKKSVANTGKALCCRAGCRRPTAFSADIIAMGLGDPTGRGKTDQFFLQVVSHPYCQEREECLETAVKQTKIAANMSLKLGPEATGKAMEKQEMPLQITVIPSNEISYVPVMVSAMALQPPVHLEILTQLADPDMFVAVDRFFRAGSFKCFACSKIAKEFVYAGGIGIRAGSGSAATNFEDADISVAMLTAELYPICGDPMIEPCGAEARIRAAIARTNSMRGRTEKPGECWRCKVAAADEKEGLMRCSACRMARYCSKECQKRDWPEHKEICRKLAEARKGRPAEAA